MRATEAHRKYQFIEVVLQWEGGVTTSKLQDQKIKEAACFQCKVWQLLHLAVFHMGSPFLRNER